jgi:purine-binding chemotaxis protein CheW
MMEQRVETAENEGRYLTFELGRQGFGIPLVRVREIVAMMGITPLPLAPNYVRGVINLRGRVIVVVDLGLKFAMPRSDDDSRKCIVVCDVVRHGKSSQMSILVDAVSEVLHIASENIEAPPAFDDDVDTSFIRGLAKTESSVTILLDIDVVLSAASVVLPALHPAPES